MLLATENYKLSPSTIEKLGYYVYLLIDPRNEKVFYVGKGHGNRINQHLLGALNTNTFETEKILTIREIEQSGLKVSQIILRHQLTEKEAFEVECAVIDLLGKENMTNIVNGHNSEDRGIMRLSDLKIKYEAEKAIIEEPLMLININKRYDRRMSDQELYEATRQHWKVSLKRASTVNFACSVYQGIIREVYIIHGWLPSTVYLGRHIFEGILAPSDIREKYVNKSVAEYWKKGRQNPIKYVDIQ